MGTASFGQFVNNMWGGIVDMAFKAVEKMVSNWILYELTKSGVTSMGVAQRTAAEAAGHTASAAMDFIATLKAVTNAAVKAATGAFNAFASNPFTLAFAPAAAAATFVAVEAFGALASASGGYDIPSGVNPVVQTHAEEMILPATLANPLRNMLAANGNGVGGSGASNDNGGSAGGDHYHIAVSALDTAGLDAFMRGPGGDKIVKGIIAKRRQNTGGRV